MNCSTKYLAAFSILFSCSVLADHTQAYVWVPDSGDTSARGTITVNTPAFDARTIAASDIQQFDFSFSEGSFDRHYSQSFTINATISADGREIESGQSTHWDGFNSEGNPIQLNFWFAPSSSGDYWHASSNPVWESTGTGSWKLIPTYPCFQFLHPLESGYVKVKKNRVLPLRETILDEYGMEVTDVDITAPPVVVVRFQADPGSSSFIDVTDDALSAGRGSDGNQFYFGGSGAWTYNLRTSNYTAPGRYVVIMRSGNPEEYRFEPECNVQFLID